jgi:hypothetical protein
MVGSRIFLLSSTEALCGVKRGCDTMLMARDFWESAVFNCLSANDVQDIFLANHKISIFSAVCHRSAKLIQLPANPWSLPHSSARLKNYLYKLFTCLACCKLLTCNMVSVCLAAKCNPPVDSY